MVTLTVADLALAYWVARSVQELLTARTTVPGNWTLTVLVDIAASLTLTGAAAGWFRKTARSRASGRRAAVPAVTLVLILVAGMATTAPAVMPGSARP